MRPAEQLRFLVMAANTEGRRQLGQQLRALGITAPQAEALRLIQDLGTTNLREVGQLLVCESGTNPSRLVTRLVEQGLVDRQASTIDRRAIQLSLTTQGRALCAEIASIEHHMYEMLDTMGHDDIQRTINLLRRYVNGTPSGRAIEHRITHMSSTSQAAPLVRDS